ncbi:hypothetical protein [Solidesulfovibrio fructosivorans]|uniref:hypothetical protein n=1 Tax=Solidesulfovibrio fructosivorans TaxID=878 RepID=UPI00117D35FA|nr:hypothetical protein [Solidesulfovibrio fructosivorans]
MDDIIVSIVKGFNLELAMVASFLLATSIIRYPLRSCKCKVFSVEGIAIGFEVLSPQKVGLTSLPWC